MNLSIAGVKQTMQHLVVLLMFSAVNETEMHAVLLVNKYEQQ